jgi:alkylhydroperoxidase family enzyme
LARRLGATDERISRLASGDLTNEEPSWAAALRASESMTAQRGEVPSDAYHELEAHWNPGQIVEIVAVIALFNYFNRFAIALDIPPTR